MNTRRTIFLSLILALVIGLSLNGYKFQEQSPSSQEKYSQVKIFASNENDFQLIRRAGLDIDHLETFADHSIAWLSASEIEMLKKSGVGYQITIDDWMEYYNSRPVMT